MTDNIQQPLEFAGKMFIDVYIYNYLYIYAPHSTYTYTYIYIYNMYNMYISNCKYLWDDDQHFLCTLLVNV